jgi:hypothetical protein
VEGRGKLLVPKIDGLWKHEGRKRALANFGNVRKGEFYFLSTNQYVKNEKIYFARGGGVTVLQQLATGVVQERRKKLVQFRLLFHLLSIGRPMTDFSNSRELLQQLEVPECLKKHWSEGSGWQMVEIMANVVSERTMQVLSDANFLSISADEVTSVDNTSWLSLHVYACQPWKRVPILLSLQRTVDGEGVDVVREMITSSLEFHGGLSESQCRNTG